MTSEINRIGTLGSGAAVVLNAQHTEQKSEPAVSRSARNQNNLERPKASTSSADLVASRENVKEAVDMLNNQLVSNKRGIGFTVNNESNTPIVTVRNTSTGEVVRQIPNEVVIKLASGLDNPKGFIHNKQA
jgi:flagellar protein FlaG